MPMLPLFVLHTDHIADVNTHLHRDDLILNAEDGMDKCQGNRSAGIMFSLWMLIVCVGQMQFCNRISHRHCTKTKPDNACPILSKTI